MLCKSSEWAFQGEKVVFRDWVLGGEAYPEKGREHKIEEGITEQGGVSSFTNCLKFFRLHTLSRPMEIHGTTETQRSEVPESTDSHSDGTWHPTKIRLVCVLHWRNV
jgi:hypothetical protein